MEAMEVEKNVKMGKMGGIGKRKNIESRRGAVAQIPEAQGKDERKLKWENKC
jgi:hypothetical protein